MMPSKTHPKKPHVRRPRNQVLLAMLRECRSAILHDRRAPRGGSRNRQHDYIREDY